MKQPRDKLGRFAKVRYDSRWLMIMLFSGMTACFLALAIDAVAQELLVENEPAEVVGVSEEEVRIQILYSEESIIKEIHDTFPDAPIMERVARCESQLDQFAYNPTNNSHDRGIFQISRKYHGQDDHDMYDVKKNIAFARTLYDKNGLRDWNASRDCWQ